jgi:hypothetical protein
VVKPFAVNHKYFDRVSWVDSGAEPKRFPAGASLVHRL